jgi:hypothetical protein
MASTLYDGTTYLSTAETAKLVRKALKAAFPGVKFSVRSSEYAGGSSISVRYTDGPRSSKVDAVAGQYAGADFDGMIDLKTYSTHWMEPDGTVKIAHAQGTEASRGYLPTVINDPPSANAGLVRMGADYIIVQREISPERRARIEAEIASYVGEDTFEPNRSYPVSVFRMGVDGAALARDAASAGNWGTTLVYQLADRDCGPCSCPGDETYPCGPQPRRCSLCGEVA